MNLVESYFTGSRLDGPKCNLTTLKLASPALQTSGDISGGAYPLILTTKIQTPGNKTLDAHQGHKCGLFVTQPNPQQQLKYSECIKTRLQTDARLTSWPTSNTAVPYSSMLLFGCCILY